MDPHLADELGIRPLTARSLVLSVLLGTHPPRLSVRALVGLAEPFGMTEGTLRTAISRMLQTGELEGAEGTYSLGGRLRERQASQDLALSTPEEPWDGAWWLVTVDAPARSIAERRAFRTLMVEQRLGELRPDTWLRPANVPRPSTGDGVLVIRGAIHDQPPAELAGRLWDLPRISATARDLLARADEAHARLRVEGRLALHDSLLVSVAAVRFLRQEPLLPATIVGQQWPSNQLRTAYQRLQRDHQVLVNGVLLESGADSVA